MTKRRRQAKSQASHHSGSLTDFYSPPLQTAHELWNTGRQSEALQLYADAIRAEPDNVRAYVMAARAHAQRFDFEGMERVHDMLLDRAPRHFLAHHHIGETFSLLKLPRRAMESFVQAERLPGAGPPTWFELARLHERAHRLDEAGALVKRIVQSGFDRPPVILLQGRIQRRRRQFEEAEATFRSLLMRITEDTPLACEAWGELALVRDHQEDWQGAIQAIERAKRVQKQHAGPHRAAAENQRELMQEMVDHIQGDDLARWKETTTRLPQHRVALLTGFPRSGTTLLEQVLDAHPDLISSEERGFIGGELLHTLLGSGAETSILNVLRRLGTSEIDAERTRYIRAMEYLLGECIGGRMHLDKNPSYNLIIPIMLRVFPEARLVVALRDPRDVVLSCYLRYLPLNTVSVHFLDLRHAAERYAFEMNAWLKFRELIDVPWCEVRYEDLVADFESQARRALATFNLPWDARVVDYRSRLWGEKQVTSSSSEAVAQPIYTTAIGRWKNYAPYLEASLSILEPFVAAFGYRG